MEKPPTRPAPILRRPFRTVWEPSWEPAIGDVNLLLEPIEEQSNESILEQPSGSETYELAEDEERWDDDNGWDDEGLDDGTIDEGLEDENFDEEEE